MQTQRPVLHEFFVATQARAFRQAEIAVGNRDDAMDIVQDAMIRLARNYSDREQDWNLLFHRILQNLIRDWFRRRKVRGIFVRQDNHEDDENDIQDHITPTPEQNKQQEQLRQQISTALSHLPLRQQQAFLLRSWWGHDVAETAYIMRCTKGSVKTHYSRALEKLQIMLGEIAP